MTLVIATGGIDLSVGAVMAICGAIAAERDRIRGGTAGCPPSRACRRHRLRALERLLVAVIGIQPIVATLILMVAGRGIRPARHRRHHPDPSTMPASPGWFQGTFLGLPTPVVIWLAIGLLVTLVVRRSALGMADRGRRHQHAAPPCSPGVNARLLIIAAYMVAGLCAAIAGIIVTADIRGRRRQQCGLFLELDAILAVVVGGTSLLGGTSRSSPRSSAR